MPHAVRPKQNSDVHQLAEALRLPVRIIPQKIRADCEIGDRQAAPFAFFADAGGVVPDGGAVVRLQIGEFHGVKSQIPRFFYTRKLVHLPRLQELLETV